MSIEIVVPIGALGESDRDTALDWAMREIAKVVSTDEGEWADKYGSEFDDDVFLMKPYCWCEKQGECPWCTGCAIYQERGECKVCSMPSLTVAQRRAAPLDQRCDYSAGRGIFARFQPWTLDHDTRYYDPPNFWYKPTNLRVKWYKYIGREMRTNRPFETAELERIVADCEKAARASAAKRGGKG